MTSEEFYKLLEIGATVNVNCGNNYSFALDLSDDVYSGFSVNDGIVRFWCHDILCLIALKYFSFGLDKGGAK